MAGRIKIGERLSLILDEDLRREVADKAEYLRCGVAETLRLAIRRGLPFIENPGALEPLSLDGELSADVDRVAQWQKWNRAKVLSEAVRLGLPSVHTRWTHSEAGQSEGRSEEQTRGFEEALYSYHPDALPLARDYASAQRTIRSLRQTLAQIRETSEGDAAIAKLEAIFARRKAAGIPMPLGNPPLVIPRDEVEREWREIEAERKASLPQAKKAPSSKHRETKGRDAEG